MSLLTINLLVFVLTFLFMEAWAWASHKYLLHGPLWFIHKSHHRKRESWWEWNDLVSVVYALLAAVLIMYGAETGHWTLGCGVGIAVYGVFYFLFHDVIIHQRIKVKTNFKNKYVRRLIRAHKMHHKTDLKTPGEAFGFLYADKKYTP